MQVSAIGAVVLGKVSRRASGENHKLEMGGVNGGGASYLKPGQGCANALGPPPPHPQPWYALPAIVAKPAIEGDLDNKEA